MIHIGVCDDDQIFATKIETMLFQISKRKLIEIDVEVFSDGSELWKDILSGSEYDLLYLDIEMVKVNGIDVAKKIRKDNMEIIIIYISNYDNYFIDLFEVEPFRFIKKPVDEKIFSQYFLKAYEKLIDKDVYFDYKFKKIYHRVLLRNIFYFESSGRLIKIFSKEGEGKFYGKLNVIENKLASGKVSFLRIHQSYLINYRFVKEITFYKVVLFDGTELQISEDRQKLIRAKYAELMGGDYLDC